MSMYGAIDLSSLAPSSGNSTTGSLSPASSAPAQGSAASAGASSQDGRVPAPLIVDVDRDSLRDVAQVSTQVPVIVVVHSARSQASQDLAQLLARVAVDYDGAFELARVDTDTSPEVAQALGASAIPTVLALLAGQPVPMFQGSMEETQLRGLLDQVLRVAANNGITGRVSVDTQPAAPQEPEETETERAARLALEAGDFDAAIEVYDHAIAQNPGDDTLKVAREQIRMMARMDGKDPHALLAAADANPEDVEAALAGADAALALGDVNAALGRGLEAVRSHSGEEREIARKRLVELFDVIGTTTPEVARARRQLATMLF